MKLNISNSRRRSVQAALLFFAVLCGIFVAGQDASAQTNNPTAFQVQQFRPWGDPQGMFQTQSGETLGHLNYSVGVYFNYAKDPLVIYDKNTGKRQEGIVQHQIGADFYGAIGLWDFMEIGLALPMTLYQMGTIPSYSSIESSVRGRDISGYAFADPKLQLKFQALKAKKHWLNLGFRLFVGFPFGAKDKFNGEDGVSFGAGIMANKWFSIVNIALNVGYRYLPPSTFIELKIQHELTYSLGATFRVHKKYVDLIGELSGATALSDQTSLASAPLDFYAGGRIYPLGNRNLAINVGFGMGAFYPGYGSPQFRVFLGLAWAPRIIDTDKDGVFDDKDRCVTVPGPKENTGCPWGDKDGDGIKDNVDGCPDKAGPKENKGCPWGDKDGDGLTDNVDGCPDKAGPKANKGCPWGDKDGDGLKDNVDGCPSKPGPKANKGCPWGDKDNDGITDNKDRCPNTPGLKQFKGCPDNDKDGIANIDDKCPFVPGVANTKNPEKHGCPKVVLVKVTKGEIKILQKIYFATGSARIRLKSYQVLDQVVAVLKSRPKIRIRIEGHTDDVGRTSSNLRLSERRAKSVFRYLSKKGIAEDRMEHKGYGESQPLVGGPRRFTRKQRSQNRRVQFKILGK